jgi:hypothetical protein
VGCVPVGGGLGGGGFQGFKEISGHLVLV